MARGYTEADVETSVSRLLRAGVLIASILVAVGGVIYLARHGGEAPAYAEFRGALNDPWSLRGVIDAIGHGRGRGLIQLGLLALIATPVARVAFSLYAFVRLRDLAFVIISATVLGVLGFSLLSAR